MPGIGSLVREIAVKISENVRKQTQFCSEKPKPAWYVLIIGSDSVESDVIESRNKTEPSISGWGCAGVCR